MMWKYANDKGNLLKGSDNKTVRGKEYKRLYPLFTYALFSVVTHSLQGYKMVRYCNKIIKKDICLIKQLIYYFKSTHVFIL